MNCDWVQQNICLFLYNELADDARHELEQHIRRCTACAAELAAQQEFQVQMNALPVEEPSASFLAAARMRLQEALESAGQHRAWHHRFAFDPMVWLRQLRFSPALAAVLLMVGFGSGLGTMYSALGGKAPHPPAQSNAAIQEASVGGITSIDRKPNSSHVQIHYDRIVPESVEGSVSDPKIQELLAYAAKSSFNNSGVRLDSVDLLTSKPDDPRAREALTYALRYDSNPGVRLKALDGLGPFVRQDVRVRNAVLEALLDDSNLGVRSGALHALEPVRADSSVRMALQQLSKEDPSQYIRTESQRVLASMPNID
ncbi:MAG TPA: HEAT repeat domain-containing protein [Candidatus Binatia bacterium]|nr:HEAT repeat domain-containing protein [Candidatus Binatia bacterium]